jgi:hypothetical protein
VGLVISVGLTLSVPLYADAVYYRVLREELTQTVTGEQITRPPFAYMFRYIGAWAGALDWGKVQDADTYFSNVAGPALGLPEKKLIRYFKKNDVKKAVMLGTVAPNLAVTDLKLDFRLMMLAFKVKDRRADAILGTVADELMKDGIGEGFLGTVVHQCRGQLCPLNPVGRLGAICVPHIR